MRITPQNGAREEVGPAVGGGPLVRIWGPAAATGTLVVAASRLGALSSDDGGVGSIRGRRARPWGGGVVAREAVASERVVGRRGARRV